MTSQKRPSVRYGVCCSPTDPDHQGGPTPPRLHASQIILQNQFVPVSVLRSLIVMDAGAKLQVSEDGYDSGKK